MQPLTNSKDCNSYLRHIFPYNAIDYEECIVGVFLNSEGVRIDFELIENGRYSECDFGPKQIKKIIKKAFKLRSKFIVLAHNHPCGSLEPSPGDIERTERLKTVLSELDITLVDHIILVKKDDAYYSFKDAGLLGLKKGKSN